jgi:hypothetical protein
VLGASRRGRRVDAPGITTVVTPAGARSVSMAESQLPRSELAAMGTHNDVGADESDAGRNSSWSAGLRMCTECSTAITSVLLDLRLASVEVYGRCV